MFSKYQPDPAAQRERMQAQAERVIAAKSDVLLRLDAETAQQAVALCDEAAAARLQAHHDLAASGPDSQHARFWEAEARRAERVANRMRLAWGERLPVEAHWFANALEWPQDWPPAWTQQGRADG